MTADNSPLVQTSKGAVRGVAAGGVHAFKGIPFAKPPVGPLRFKPAQPADPWEGELAATAYGNAPMQMKAPLPSVQNPLSEDCLYLNVFAPATPGPHGVFVWLFGGGDSIGEGGIDLFDGTEFAKRGVVLVTINYRVGGLGFMKLDHLLGPDYAGASNAGMTDIIQALHWVHDEIAAFGGDPGRVTVGGESAGAKNTTTLLATNDEVRGLFQSVILESGTGQCVWDDHTSRVMADATLRTLGVDAANAEALLTIDAQQLVDAFGASLDQPGVAGFNTRPTVDGSLVQASGLDAARAGQVNGFRVLIGNNHDEYDLFMSSAPLDEDPGADRMDYVATPRMAADINARYKELLPDVDDVERRFRIMCDEEWWIPNVRYVEALLENGRDNQVWMYRFDFQPTGSPMNVRSCHGSEIAFVFHTLGSEWAKYMPGDTPGAHELSVRVIDAWARFINGDAPGGGELPEWPLHDLERRAVMLLDHHCRVEADPWGDRREAWFGVQ